MAQTDYSPKIYFIPDSVIDNVIFIIIIINIDNVGMKYSVWAEPFQNEDELRRFRLKQNRFLSSSRGSSRAKISLEPAVSSARLPPLVWLRFRLTVHMFGII